MFKYSILPSDLCIAALLLITILLPMVGVTLILSFPKKENSGLTVSVISSIQLIFLLCIFLTNYNPETVLHHTWTWFHAQEGLSFIMGIYVDFLTWLMLIMLAWVVFLVSLYAQHYFKNEAGQKRYFIQVSLFVSAIYWIILADNLLSVYVGWEIVSLFSALLIGFWYTDDSVVKASCQVLLINKIGSFFFMIGLLVLLYHLKDVSFVHLKQFYSNYIDSFPSWSLLAIFFFLAAVLIKVALFPFFIWLPRAMVAPIPVSSLLHTAAVLGVGVYFLCRIQPMLMPSATTCLVIIGYLVAFLASTSALVQHQIKRMLAYGTVSHIGLIVAAMGLGVPGEGMLFFMEYTFSKVSLFLCLGMVEKFYSQQKNVHLSNPDSVLQQGRLVTYLPLVAGAYLLAIVILSGFPSLQGFSIKEELTYRMLSWTVGWAQEGYAVAYLLLILDFFSNIFTILYLFRSFYVLFLSPASQAVSRPVALCKVKGHIAMQLSICALFGALCLLFLFPTQHFILHHFYSFCLRLYPSIAMLKPVAQKTAYLNKILLVGGWVTAFIFLVVVKKFRNLPAYNSRGLSLLVHGWYLDTGMEFIARHVVTYSKWMVGIEERFSRSNKIFGASFFSMARLIALVDRTLVAGMGYGIAGFWSYLSNLYGHMQRSTIQFQLVCTCIAGTLLFLVGWLLWF